MKKLNINKKSLKYGALSTALTAIVIVAVILVNMIAVMIEREYPINVDLTKESVFTMGEKTSAYLNSLDETVNIFVMMDEFYFESSDDKDYRHAYYLLRQYTEASNGKVTLTYDQKLISDSAFCGKFPVASFQFGDVIVVYKSEFEQASVTNYRKFNIDSCFTQTEYNEIKYDISKLEQTVTSSIMYLNSENSKKIGLVAGHGGEAMSEELDSLLKSNIYSVTSVDLAAGTEIPEDISVLLILQPKTDFTKDELAKLEKFLDGKDGKLGKSLMIYVDQNTPKMPELSAVLDEWGLVIGDGIVYDKADNSYYGFNNYDTIAAYYNTEDNKVFSDSLIASDLHLTTPDARPIEIKDRTNVGIQTTAIINSYSSAKVRDSKAAELSDEDKSGTYTIAAMATKMRTLDQKTYRSSIMLCGSAQMINESFLTSSSFSNDSGLIETLNYCAGRDIGVVVSAKNITTATLDLEVKEQYWLAIVFIFIIPAVIAVVGVVVNIKRRHL